MSDGCSYQKCLYSSLGMRNYPSRLQKKVTARAIASRVIQLLKVTL